MIYGVCDKKITSRVFRIGDLWPLVCTTSRRPFVQPLHDPPTLFFFSAAKLKSVFTEFGFSRSPPSALSASRNFLLRKKCPVINICRPPVGSGWSPRRGKLQLVPSASCRPIPESCSFLNFINSDEEDQNIWFIVRILQLFKKDNFLKNSILIWMNSIYRRVRCWEKWFRSWST